MKSAPKHSRYFAYLTGLALFISLIGLVAVYNASVVEAFNDFHDKYYFVKQQAAWLLLGLFFYFTASSLPLKFYKKIALPFLVVALLSLVLAGLFLIFSSSYRLERLKTFIEPTGDPLGRSYHINQVLLGLGSGGLFGVGLGRSRQKYAYLPEATTDSIFAIVGEELGLIGSLILIGLLLSLSLLAFRIAFLAPDQHGRLLAAGVAILFSAQTFVNLASMVAMVPLTGIPLPLISYGGSALVTTFAALGILASVARQI